MSDIIEWVLVLEVKDGQAENVQSLLDEMVSATKDNEPGTLHYEYYANDDLSQVTVLERYKNTDAAMVHMGNFGAKFAPQFLTAFAPISFSVFGPAGVPLKEALAPFGATFTPMISGFHR